MLRQFDMNSAYGPCLGMTRMERWERARKFGLNPPKDIETLLKAGKVQLECLWDGRVWTPLCCLCYVWLMYEACAFEQNVQPLAEMMMPSFPMIWMCSNVCWCWLSSYLLFSNVFCRPLMSNCIAKVGHFLPFLGVLLYQLKCF